MRVRPVSVFFIVTAVSGIEALELSVIVPDRLADVTCATATGEMAAIRQKRGSNLLFEMRQRLDLVLIRLRSISVMASIGCAARAKCGDLAHKQVWP